jgi:hypothetical protein
MLSEASLVQPPAFGTFTTQTGTASLPNPTQDGSTVLLLTFRNNSSSLEIVAAGFMDDGPSLGAGGNTMLQRRHREVFGGENSWPLDAQFPSSGNIFAWLAYEFSSVDRVSPLDQYATNSGLSVATLSTGTTPQVDDTDIACIAVHATSSAVTTMTPQTAGFVKGEEITLNNGSGNITVMVSRAYPGAGGTYECTADLGGTMGLALGAMLVYRAAAEEPFSQGGQATVV